MQQTKLMYLVTGLIIVAALALGWYYITSQSPSPIAETSNNAAPQGKINIDEVCNGALAYMSFGSGAEADAFVQECKEGKRPEVIEQYKVQMGISSDVAI